MCEMTVAMPCCPPDGLGLIAGMQRPRSGSPTGRGALALVPGGGAPEPGDPGPPQDREWLGPATAEATDTDAARESLIAAHHETAERDGRRRMMARRRVLRLHAAARTARRRRTCGTWWWSGRGVGVLHGGRERLGAPLHRRWVHPHDLPAVAVEVEEAA